MDIHPYDCSEQEYQRFITEKNSTARLGPGERFGIPLRHPRSPKAGKISGWPVERLERCRRARVHPRATRSFLMGQAAGTAAVQSLRNRPAAARAPTCANSSAHCAQMAPHSPRHELKPRDDPPDRPALRSVRGHQPAQFPFCGEDGRPMLSATGAISSGARQSALSTQTSSPPKSYPTGFPAHSHHHSRAAEAFRRRWRAARDKGLDD